MNKTSIEWTDYSANPLKFRDAAGKVVWACEKTSPGCKNCYAATLAKRYGRGSDFNADEMSKLTPFLDENELRRMLTYKPAAGKRCFVGDMTDIFGEWVPDELLDRLFAAFALRSDVTWQVLTKRAKRMREYLESRNGPSAEIYQATYTVTEDNNAGRRVADGPWPLTNVWLGVSCEDQQRANERIPELLQTPAAIRFISAEPLLGPINLAPFVTEESPSSYRMLSRYYGPNGFDETGSQEERKLWTKPDHGLHWIIPGGESGGGARGCEVAWIRSLRRQAKAIGAACFLKQLGARVIDRNDAGFLSETPTSWPDVIDQEDRIERDLDGTVDGYQGAPVRIRLKDRKGGDPSEWPEDLRVREFPRVAVPA